MGEKFDEAIRLLDSGIRNIVQSSYDEYCKQNAEFRAKAGLEMLIVRESLGECCTWCSDLEGVYAYDTAPDDVYARHRECNCVVSTRTKKGTFQDAWTKKEYKSYRENRIAREQEFLKTQKSKKDSPEFKEVKARWKLNASKSDDKGKTIRKELGEIPPENAEKAIEFFKNEIRDFKNENAIVIEKTGKVVQFIGDERSVEIFEVNMEGAYILHNHPESNGIVSFGAEDFYLIKENPNAIYDLVNAEWDYHLKVIKPISHLTYSDLKDFVTGNVQTIEDLNDDWQHILMQGLSDKGYVKYGRTKKR